MELTLYTWCGIADHIGDNHDLICDVCGRACLSKVEKLSHMQSHCTRVTANYEMALNTQICGKVGK